MDRPAHRWWLPLLVITIASCKVPVEDQVPTPTSIPGVRGQPPPEARPYVLQKAPPIRYRVQATFGDEIALLGYDVPKQRFRPGETVPITLFWKALKDPSTNWKVFMHLDPAGIDNPRMRGYGDHFPVFGMYPPRLWKAGQIIRDQVTIPLRRSVRTATAELWVGFYESSRRARLRTSSPTDGKNRLKLAVFSVVGGRGDGLPGYVVHRAAGPIKIDGRLDEAAWQQIPSTGRFVRTMGGGRAAFDTWAKLLWDSTHLYIAFYCADPDIVTPYQKRDDDLWRADVVEVFLDADGDQKNYYELQVSPANVIFDAFFPKRGPPSKRGGDLSYTAGIRSAVRLDGTLNKRGDRDRSWTVEMAIPWKDLKHAPHVPPRPGDTWRANLIRIERTSGRVQDMAWSAPGGDYHNLSAMGKLRFSAATRPSRGRSPKMTSKAQLLRRLREQLNKKGGLRRFKRRAMRPKKVVVPPKKVESK